MQIPLRVGFPIRKSADQRSLASPRSLSQRATSFIASWRQGIHRTLLSRSIHTTNARTQDQTPRCNHQLTKLTDSASLIHSFVHDTSVRAKLSPHTHGRSRDQPIRFTCQTSRLPDQIPKGTINQATNLSCSSTSPSQEHQTALNQPGQSYGDGRYRTDGPLLAKQVLYH